MKRTRLYPLTYGLLAGLVSLSLTSSAKDSSEGKKTEAVTDKESLKSGKSAASEKVDKQAASERSQKILDFWFGQLPNSGFYPEAKVSIWLGQNGEANQTIRNEFFQDIQQALSGQLNHWRDTLKGRLALIILLDQFLPLLYPNSSKSFISNAMSKGLVLEGMQNGDDKSLYPVEQAFFYMPFQQSEDTYMQILGVSAYKQIVENSPAPIKPKMQEFYNIALTNQQIIARFGRFPQRNVFLGRQSTPEELIFLSHQGNPFFSK